MDIEKIKIPNVQKVIISSLKADSTNPNSMSKENFNALKKNISRYGFLVPVITNRDGVIADGYHRYRAGHELGMSEIPVIMLDVDEVDRRILRQVMNKLKGQHDEQKDFNEWEFLKENDAEKLLLELLPDADLDIDLEDVEVSITEDDFKEPAEPKYEIIKGQVWKLGEHRLMCGDCTDKETVEYLCADAEINLVFTDPPYGMKKENDGVLNDNLNYDDLLNFNAKWIPNTFDVMADVGSWYCWGIDEPLMDIYSNILKPMIRDNKIVFRNLITWNKGNGQGQTAEAFRSYAIADEKCLFVMKGVQGFNTNADNYHEGFEPIRLYLLEQRNKCGWSVPDMKTIAGHSDKSRDHWTNKSQWNFLTEKVYLKFQDWAIENEVDAFQRSYTDLKQEYESLKQEFYESRAYFNNTHDNMNNVWNISRESDRQWGHATPKPLEVCERAIKSSSRKGDNVLDVFGGSGSTLIACEQLGRRCFIMELDKTYCSVIIERWEKLTGKKAQLVE